MTEDSMHRTLDAALARNSGPSAEDVEALADLFDQWERGLDGANETDHWADRLARALLASDWLAAHTAAAEARGAERGARAVVEAVETTFLGQLPSKALSYCAQEDVNAGLDALAERFGLDGDPR